MKNFIRIILDRHFPYDREGLKTSGTSVRPLSLPKAVPTPLARIFHVLDLYYRSFNADIVLGNRRTALLLGLLYQIHKPKKVSLIGYEIIFNFKNNFKHKLVKLVWRLAVRNIDRLVVMTESERNYLAREFRTPQEKFSTINFYAEDARYIGPKADGYIFAAGRMERDFETLIRALSGTPYPAVIVADGSQKEKMEKIKPSNIRIFYNIAKEQYLQLLYDSKIVAVPLYDGAASRGQVVILEAMKHGKPVVCTRVKGTEDYLTHGQEGFFTAPENPEELRWIFERYFENSEELEKTGRKAFATQQSRFTPEIFFRRYHELIQEEYHRKNRLAAPGEVKERSRKTEGTKITLPSGS